MWLLKIIFNALLFRDAPPGANPPIHPWMLRLATLLLIVVVIVIILLEWRM